MLIIHGVYHFHPKRIAFRNDYCLPCSQARRSVQMRTFDVAHIFWIPIIPLGYWNRWICTACGRQTTANTKTRRPFKWAGLFVLLILSVLSWAGSVPQDLVVGAWIIRIGAPIGAILVLLHLLRTSDEPSHAEHLKSIPPAVDAVCPFCGAQLLTVSSRCACPACGVVRS